MKHIRFATITALLAASAFLSSCSKDDAVDVNANTSASLTPGKAGIVFNSNNNFVTGTTFNVRNASSTQASTSIVGSTRVINLTAIEFTDATNQSNRTANISILMPDSYTTASGSLVSDLSTPGTEDIVSNVTLTSMASGTAGTTYESEMGTLTITKLTSTEIEGNFNGTVRDTDAGVTTLVLSNGTFAGKFQ